MVAAGPHTDRKFANESRDKLTERAQDSAGASGSAHGLL